MSPSPANTSATKLFLDANVLLEVILRRPHQSAARAVLEQATGTVYISSLTVHLVVHFGRTKFDLPVLQKFLASFEIASIGAGEVDWAFYNSRSDDFEDALQLAAAISQDCDEFITFDKGLRYTYRDLPFISIKLM